MFQHASRVSKIGSLFLIHTLHEVESIGNKKKNLNVERKHTISYHVCVILCLTYFHIYSELKTRVSALESELAQAADESAEKVSVFEKKIV